MATKEKKRQQGLRRETWSLRMGIYALLFVGVVGLVAYVLLSGGSGQDGATSSRFEAVHRFDTADLHALAFDPADPQDVLFGHHGGLQKSIDGGESWGTEIDQANWDAMNIVFDPFSPDIIYAAGHDVLFKSTDAGANWEPLRPNLPSLDLHTFGASPADEGRLYAVPAGMGLYASDDRGETWQLVSEDVPPGSNSIVELPDGTLLIGATDQGILRSDDGGHTWSSSRQGIDVGAIYAIRADPDGRRLYAGTDHGLYVSTDGGSTWLATALDDTWVVVVGVNPADPMNVLAINRNGELYRSTDGGQSWGS